MPITSYSRYLSPAHPGMFHGLGDPRIDAYINRNSPLNDIWSVAIVAPVVNTVYKVSVDGYESSYKAVTGDTQGTLGLKLYQAIVQNPLIYRAAQFTYDPVANSIAIESRDAKVLAVTSTLTATRTQNAGVLPPPIPFGRAVGAKSAYNDKEVTLPTSASDVIKGVAISTHWIERVGVPAGPAAYQPLDTVNVCDRTNNLKGVYVQCVETDIVQADPVYVAVSPSPNQGKFTKTATGNISVPQAAFKSGTITTPEGGNMILLQINL